MLALGGFNHADGCPAQGHLGILLSFDVALDAAGGAAQVLDDIGAGRAARRSSAGRPRRVTVKISPMPSKMLPETPGEPIARMIIQMKIVLKEEKSDLC